LFPNSLAATHRGFTIYVADPVSFIHYFEQMQKRQSQGS